ncbi:MAG: ornithine cyclodeaminase family protein [Candidatus Tectomicrobia bacterium]|nr:ornithine cyclodeaminase family protein [Candidatus Tectomicrobia bacterium]
MKLRILTEEDVRSLLSMSEAIDVQAEAFRVLAQGRSVQGLRSFAVSETPPGIAIFNPSFLKGGGGYGVKVVSDFYENEKKGVPRMTALVALFDGETGRPTTVMEGAHLTDLRTGAGTGLAARHLARKDCRTVAVIGAGRVARNQLAALAEVCPLEKAWVSTRTERRGREFVERMSAEGGRVPRDIGLVESREEAVRKADIVVAATTSHTPVFPGAALKSGTFVVAAGAYEATAREVDTETIRRASKWVVDSPADCLKDAGDLVIPMQEGVIREEQIAGIADLVDGRRPGRESDEEITYYKSMGVPIQDLVTAQRIERRAVERGVGRLIEIGGDHD